MATIRDCPTLLSPQKLSENPFSLLTQEEIRAIANEMTVRLFDKGTILVHEGFG